MKRLVVLLAVVLLAGCSGVVSDEMGDREIPDGMGEVEGISYDETLDIDPADGLTEAELETFTKRTMARIEVIRTLEFERSVDVEIFTREEYRDWRANRSRSAAGADWTNQIWRSLFLIGQDRNATAVLDDAFGDAVQGFYQPGQDRIIVVSDSETPIVNKKTLIHELVHALQDQHFGLEFGHETRDEQAAYDTLVEGEAELVSQRYLDHWCEEWSCLRPELATGGIDDERSTLEPGIRLVLTQPYVQGREFVDRVESTDGWEGVNALHDDPPRSTAAVIAPDRPVDSAPETIEIPDRSTDGWERFDHQPTGDTLGVASIYSMFAANEIIAADEPGTYSHPVTEGWAGDRLVPYRNGQQFGYVWELAWHSNDDADQFAAAYRELLQTHGGLARGADSYVVPDGPFAGAYRVTVRGDRVRLTNGPDLDALSTIHQRADRPRRHLSAGSFGRIEEKASPFRVGGCQDPSVQGAYHGQSGGSSPA